MRAKSLPPQFHLSDTKDDTKAALNTTLAIASVGIATLTMLETLLPAAAEEVSRTSQDLSKNVRTLLSYVDSKETPPQEVSAAISHIITGMQFEDRNTQIMDNVVAILERYRTMLEDIYKNIDGMQAGSTAPGHTVAEAVEDILSGIRLGDIRTRYIEALAKANVGYDEEKKEDQPGDNNVIELF